MPIFQGDNNRVVKFETNEDLTNCISVVVTISRPDGNIFTKIANVLDIKTGKCSFTLFSGDLSVSGDYLYQWTLSFSDGTVESDLIFHINVKEKLGNANIITDTVSPIITANLTGGTYTSVQNVSLTANETASIYYTIDGSVPTTTSKIYTGPILISSNTTLKYFGKDLAGNVSSIQTVDYIISIPDTTTPVITSSSTGGLFNSSQTVTLSANEAAAIYYTLDNSNPTTLSSVYSGPITISYSSTLKFFGKDIAGNTSAVQSIDFTIDTVVPTVSVLPTGGTYATSQTIALSVSEAATVYYTLDGSTPTISSSVYNGPLTFISSTTLKYFAKDTAGNQGIVYTQSYVINLSDTNVPNPATNLTLGMVTSSSAQITWTLSDSNDVANYEVAYQTGGGTFVIASNVVNSSSTSYTVTGLNASTTYTIRIVAIDTSGNRSTSATINVTTDIPADTTAPVISANPTGGTYTGSQSVTLSSNETSTIYYTTDGTTPTYPVSGTTLTYSSPIIISTSMTLKYIGVDTSTNISSVVTQTYTINPSVVTNEPMTTWVGGVM